MRIAGGLQTLFNRSIYVSSKVPKEKLNAADVVPKTLDSVRTRVIEVGQISV